MPRKKSIPGTAHYPFGPSRWPILLDCAHFEGKTASANAERGTALHELFARVLKGVFSRVDPRAHTPETDRRPEESPRPSRYSTVSTDRITDLFLPMKAGKAFAAGRTVATERQSTNAIFFAISRISLCTRFLHGFFSRSNKKGPGCARGRDCNAWPIDEGKNKADRLLSAGRPGKGETEGQAPSMRRLWSMALASTSANVAQPSFRLTLRRWTSTVRAERPSLSAISLVVRPAPTQ